MTSTFVVPDSVSAVLRVTGEDAFAYLQSQFSGDLRPALAAGDAVYGLWLSRKGRVEADGLVVACGREELWVISYYTKPAALLSRVSSNIVADDVAVDSPDVASWTLVGEGADEALRRAGLPVPRDGGFARDGDLLVVAGRRGARSFDILASGDSGAERVRLGIQNQVTLSDASALESLRVASGLPRVPEDCGPGDLPQEAGLDAEAVSFGKGCFLGQEVMARLKAQGTPTRVLARVTLDPAAADAPPGATLWAGGAACGELRSRASVGAACVAFAMLKKNAISGVDTFSLAPGGVPVARLHPSV